MIKNVLSLFDGMSCGRIALDRANINIERYFSSEIKTHALNVANDNYPQDKQYRLGDVTKIISSDLPKIDLLIGGSPCQDFSRLNISRLGLTGQKSSLFYEWFRLYNELKPKYFLLENVIMADKYKYQISKYLKTDPINLNSSLVSAQLRNRLYWTNIPYLGKPKDKQIKLSDIITSGYTNLDKSRCLLSSFTENKMKCGICKVHRFKKFCTFIFKNKQHYYDCLIHYKNNRLNYKANDCELYDGIRSLNKLEMERLQNLPENYTRNLTLDECGNLTGDGWTVDIISHLFSSLDQEQPIINRLF